jgi:hypothetical protein
MSARIEKDATTSSESADARDVVDNRVSATIEERIKLPYVVELEELAGPHHVALPKGR